MLGSGREHQQQFAQFAQHLGFVYRQQQLPDLLRHQCTPRLPGHDVGNIPGVEKLLNGFDVGAFTDAFDSLDG